MQTKLIPLYQKSELGQEAEGILRSCVHCGFCNASCPSYQVLGNELDGPRGRIYQIKQLLEGQPIGEQTRLHLDRCLSCQACETTCPSGVDYHRLLDIGRELMATELPRTRWQRFLRTSAAIAFSNRTFFKVLLGLGRITKPLLPSVLAVKIPSRKQLLTDKLSEASLAVTDATSPRRLIMLEGCVQDAISPDINTATRYVFSRLGFECRSVSTAGCCGALSFHLDQQARARQQAKANLDAWRPLIEGGQCESVIMNASGCGSFIKEYATLLQGDAAYSAPAAMIAAKAFDPVEYIGAREVALLKQQLATHPIITEQHPVVFHPPCSLQHGQKLASRVEHLLQGLGFNLRPLQDAHLCCGSAGSYSLFQAEIASELRQRKLKAITDSTARYVLTANIGCQAHLDSAEVMVRHWLELVAEMLTDTRSGGDNK